jgi:hypothetical protein
MVSRDLLPRFELIVERGKLMIVVRTSEEIGSTNEYVDPATLGL